MLPPVYTAGDTPQSWPRRRRELTELFAGQVFGCRPELPYTVSSRLLRGEPALGDHAWREWHRVTVTTALGSAAFTLHLVRPTAAGPVPAVLLISNHDRAAAPAVPPPAQALQALMAAAPPDWRRRTEAMMAGWGRAAAGPQTLELGSETEQGYWPVARIVTGGRAAAAFYASEVQPDSAAAFPGPLARIFGVYSASRPADGWGTLGIWAFAASCAVDVLCRHPAVDADRIALAGHSRGAKAALWCAAQDERIAAVLVNNSGCTGAALSRGKRGENVASITAFFPHWFCPGYASYAWREEAMPFDQHLLLAAVAPRVCYVTSATQDAWSDPDAEWRSVVLAAPAWQRLGMPAAGCFAADPPPAGRPVSGGTLAYHRRTGVHDLTDWDWRQFLAFLAACGV